MKKVISIGIVFLLLILPVMAHEGEDHRGMPEQNSMISMHSWFGMNLFMLFMVLLFILFIIAIVWIVYKLTSGEKNH